MTLETIAECVGGSADGVQLDPPDKGEPDDWPDYMEIQDKQTGHIDGYHFQFTRPKVRDGRRVYTYLYEDLV